MDTTRDIIYRDFYLNEADPVITGGGAAGSGIGPTCQVDSVDYSDVDVVQWSEKRSQADGNDVGEVFMGARRVRMSGTLYALTRGTLFDNLWTLRAALNPVLAQREEPADKGYRPLYFTVPTNRVDVYPAGVIELQMKALPRAFQQLTRDDELGGGDDDSLAVPWQATFICADPGIYSADPVEYDFNANVIGHRTGATGTAATNLISDSGHGLVAGDRITFSSLTGGAGLVTGTTYYVISSGLTSSVFKVSGTSGGAEVDFTTDITAAVYQKSVVVTGTWDNRGTYLGKFNALLVVGKGAGTIVGQVGDSVFTVTVPASTVNRTIRIKDDKTITFEENAVETDQMSSIVFAGDTTWPLIDPGMASPYTISFHGLDGLQSGSRMWFYEQYA